jgi:hypothetical protein
MMPKLYFFRFLLVGLLFYPTLAQHAHIFEHHDHPVCEESTLHFHEGDTTCNLLDYVSNPQAVLPSFSFHSLSKLFLLEKTLQIQKVFSKVLFAKQLRAPPVL